MIVGFTGTREGMSDKQKETLAWLFDSIYVDEFHHGDCIGADKDAHIIVCDSGSSAKIVIHPPINTSKRAYCISIGEGYHNMEELSPYEYLERNKHIVDASQLLIVAPENYIESTRSGTWSTYRYGKGKIPTMII